MVHLNSYPINPKLQAGMQITYGGEYWTKMLLDRTIRCIISNLPVYCTTAYKLRYMTTGYDTSASEYDTILFWLRCKVTEYENTVFRLQYNITEYDITAYRVR